MATLTLPASWLSDYDTGIDFIDEQHRYFFNVLKRLERAVMEDTCRTNVADVFFRIIYYVEQYRLKEEIYYKDLKMNNLDEHKRSHREFVAAIVRFKDEFLAGREDVCSNLLEFLSGWFYSHIIGTDREVIAELRKAGF